MWALDEIGIEGSYSIPQIPKLDLTKLSYYNPKTNHILSSAHQNRTSFQLHSQLDHGSYGNVYHATRGTIPVIVKQPRMAEMNLFQEAVLQHLAHKTLEREGMGNAVPKVYDVFWNGDEIWFSMDYIQGVSVADWFAKTKTPDLDALYLLAQICLLLSTLEFHLNLDHRDLKWNNLLIQKSPSRLDVTLGSKRWHLESPFQVVLLDFGFACLGSQPLRGKPWVNLGDGVLPPMDPCPKEGRDMFHLLVSLLGLSVFRDTISKELQTQMDRWLSDGKKSYGAMARRWSTEDWSYLVSSQPNFSIPSCCPLRILQDLALHLQGLLCSSERL